MADDEFNEQDFYDHAKRAEEFFSKDISRRHHRTALKDFLHWMDRSGVGKPTGMSPGEKAASTAAIPDAGGRELEGRIKLVDNTKVVRDDPTPVSEQPKGFDEASEKAHEVFMSAVNRSEK